MNEETVNNSGIINLFKITSFLELNFDNSLSLTCPSWMPSLKEQLNQNIISDLSPNYVGLKPYGAPDNYT